jgi:predicted DsbA family dithiol-disulfide isomerase
VPAAIAFLAGARQGKFWELHDLLFEHQEDLSDNTLDECAKKVGLDMKKFAADEKDPAIIDRLRAEKTEGMKCGIKKSPGILVNGKPYYGVKTEVELRDRIEEELYLLSLK